MTVDRVNLSHTGVLVIDMQNGFVHPQGSLPGIGHGLPGVDVVIAATIELLDAARDADIPVIFTRHQFREDLLDIPARARAAFPHDFTMLVRGTWDADVIDELAPQLGDHVVEKNRYDAFLYTDLEVVLRSLGVTRLLVAGVVTSVCVESTVRSAEMRGFDVFVASDCTAAPAGMHEASLAAMAGIFATVGPGLRLLETLVHTAADSTARA